MAATSFGLSNRASNKGVKYLCSLSYKQANTRVARSVFLFFLFLFFLSHKLCHYFKERRSMLTKSAVHFQTLQIAAFNVCFQNISHSSDSIKSSLPGVNVRVLFAPLRWMRTEVFHQAGFISVDSDVKKSTFHSACKTESYL